MYCPSNIMKWSMAFLILGLCSSCAFIRVIPPSPAPDTIEVSFEQIPPEYRAAMTDAEFAFREGRLGDGLRLYGAVLDRKPPAIVAAWSHFRTGRILYSMERWSEAARSLESARIAFAGQFPENEVLYHLVLVYAKLGMYNRSRDMAHNLLERDLTPRREAELKLVMADILWQEERWSESLDFYADLLREDTAVLEAPMIRKRIETIIEEKLDVKELERLADLYGREYPAGFILYRLARVYHEEGYLGRAVDLLQEFMDYYPGDPSMTEARLLHQSLLKRMEEDVFTIGCILPLTGRFAVYGNKMLDAVILAAGIFDTAEKNPMRVLVKDSKSDPAQTRQAVEELAHEDKVVAIVGPLESLSAVEAARKAQELRVPILTLSQRDGIAGLGDYVFRFFLTTSLQLEALVSYATGRLGIQRFAILYPDDAYGREMMLRFWYAVAAAGGTIGGIEPYEGDQTDFGDQIKRLVRLDDATKENEIPRVDFDALFIPDSSLKARLIAPQLDFYDVIGVRLLGMSEWNVPELLQGEETYLEGAVFVDVFFRDSYAVEVMDFLDRFYAAYGREADGIEAIAYDATAIIIEGLINQGVRTRNELREWLLGLRNYRGVTGETSFSGDGDARKNLYILTVQDGRIVQLQ